MSMKTPEMSVERLKELLDVGLRPIVNRWLRRGDGVAVYGCVALDSSQYGTKQFMSFGSKESQWEGGEPPTRMPDIGRQINWSYQLLGTYRGEEIPLEDKTA